MGNALAFKSIFDDITADQANGYYTDIAYQYGRLIRKMFDFQPLPITSASLDATDLIDDFVFDYPQDYYRTSSVYETSRSAYLRQLASGVSTLYSAITTLTPKSSKSN
jgi:hypothetical protein